MFAKIGPCKLPSYSKMDQSPSSAADDTFISVPPTPTTPRAPRTPTLGSRGDGGGAVGADLVDTGLYIPIRIEIGREPSATPAGHGSSMTMVPRRDYAFWIFLCAILCIFAVACATVLHITASQLNQFQQMRAMELYRSIS